MACAMATEETSTQIPWGWEVVATQRDSVTPCQRSLHAAAIYKDGMYIFGGYDGTNRVNDFHQFNFTTRQWATPPSRGTAPSPRDRHVALVHGDSFYVFGGFDGNARVNDFHQYNFEQQEWSMIPVLRGVPPTPRHSHAGVVYNSCMYIFGGYDGAYKNDFHEFNFATSSWSLVAPNGRAPRARYRATCCVYNGCMYLFGGHDGSRHLNDVHVFDFDTRTWSSLQVEGNPPQPRDSHVSLVYGNSMYVFGGSTGQAMDDFHELRLDTRKWSPVQFRGVIQPGLRFCHVGIVYEDSMYVFGGYDGTSRLNDFLKFHFVPDAVHDIPPSSLIEDLRQFVNSELLSDITFIVEGTPVYAHKVMCMRCTYFRAMLTGEMMESRASEVVLHDVRHPIFLKLLEYLYTDQVEVPLEMTMELFQAADQFGVERLKKICESRMLASISVDNASSILFAADLHNAKSLRERCITFIMAHFDAVTKTSAFEEMGRTNMDLIFEILKRR